MTTKTDDCQKAAIRFWKDNGGSDYELDLLAQLLREQRAEERKRCERVATGLLESLEKRSRPGEYSEGCLDTARLLVRRLSELKEVV